MNSFPKDWPCIAACLWMFGAGQATLGLFWLLFSPVWTAQALLRMATGFLFTTGIGVFLNRYGPPQPQSCSLSVKEAKLMAYISPIWAILAVP